MTDPVLHAALCAVALFVGLFLLLFGFNTGRLYQWWRDGCPGKDPDNNRR